MKTTARKRSNPETSIRGTITHIYFTSDRFTAGRISNGNGGDTSFAGKIGGLRENDRVILRGQFEINDKYGEQFKVAGFEFDTSFDKEGIVNYISTNPEIKGVGFSRALKIAEFCKEDFDRIVTDEPERLTALPGITHEIATALHNEWVKHKDFNKCMTQLAAYDLTHKQIQSLIKKYGNAAARVIQDNPYRLIEDISGYGFKKADVIARKAGTPKSSPHRIRSAIFFILENALSDGDCYIEYRDLIARANKTLILDTLNSRELIETILDEIIGEADRVICHAHENQLFVAMKYIHEMEMFIADIFRRHVKSNKKLDMPKTMERIPDELNKGQRNAVRKAVENTVSLISGGAGTGKTYTVACIVDIYQSAGMSVCLCAPTGKAAKRMEELSGADAHTIHRLLGYDGVSFQRGPDNPLDYDVIIIDEVSMLDVPLCWRLFRAIDFENTNIVLVGDHNQLPPVGPGNILRDLIQLEIVPTTILDHVVRQAGILKENSIAILSGSVPSNAGGTDTRKEWYVVDKFTDATDILKFIIYLYENILEDKLGFDIIRDVQLLAPMKKGVLGVDNLNAELQRLIQTKCHRVAVAPTPANRRPRLYIHDKVLQNKNNYGLEVMNGAVGYIRRFDNADGTYDIEFDNAVRKFESDDMKHISLAYASTVHKMQGSECECVIAVIHKSQSFMHHRNLFYTAVTRARKTAIIIGDRWGIRNCAKKGFTDKRKTFMSLDC